MDGNGKHPRKTWTKDMFIATLALYFQVGTHPPGNENNVLVDTLARTFGISKASIRMKLFNYGNRDKEAKNHGLGGGGSATGMYYGMAKINPDLFAKMLREVRKRYRLENVI